MDELGSIKGVENYINVVKSGCKDIKLGMIIGGMITVISMIVVVTMLVLDVELRPFWVFSIAFLWLWFLIIKDYCHDNKRVAKNKWEFITRMFADISCFTWAVLNSYFTIFYIGMGVAMGIGTVVVMIIGLILETIIFLIMNGMYQDIVGEKNTSILRCIVGTIFTVVIVILAFWISEQFFEMVESWFDISANECGEKYGLGLLKLWQFVKFI